MDYHHSSWYRSIWAYIVYTLCIIGSIVYTLHKREQHLKRKYRKRVEEYQIEKDREVYKSK